MNKERSTNHDVQDTAMNRTIKVSMTEIYAQMVIDELLYNYRKQQLETLIDKSLAERNVKDFMTLTKEYNLLIKH